MKAIGIDLGGTNLRAALVRSNGEVMTMRRAPVGDVADGAGIVGSIAALAREAASGSDPIAIGIGVAGPLDHVAGRMYSPPNLPGLKDMDLARRVESVAGLPVYLENDANAAVFGEFRAGVGRGESVFVGLTLGTGVGGGILLGGEVFRGYDGSAGELGHMVVDPDGPACSCGGRGHLEGLASARATADRFRMGIQEGKARRPGEFAKDLAKIEALDVYRLASSGNAYASGILNETGKWLGVGIAILYAVFAPQTVVLLGGLAGAFDLFAPALREAFEARSMPPSREEVRIVPGELGGDAGVVGAALLALDRNAKQS